jgi:hypothetical protein
LSHPYDRYPGQPPYGGWPPPSAPGTWPAPSPYGMPPPPQGRRKRVVVAWVVAGSLLATAVLAIIAVGGFRIGSTGFAGAMAPPSMSPPADWAVIGDDEGLDAYAERCHDGDFGACDELYVLSEGGSDYEYYALTCGGRVEPRQITQCIDLE